MSLCLRRDEKRENDRSPESGERQVHALTIFEQCTLFGSIKPNDASGFSMGYLGASASALAEGGTFRPRVVA